MEVMPAGTVYVPAVPVVELPEAVSEVSSSVTAEVEKPAETETALQLV